MCQFIPAATLQHETYELLEEEAFDQLVSHPYADQLEQSWELESEEYDTADFPNWMRVGSNSEVR